MTKAWRIVKSRHQEHAFEGEGSRLYGGRWTNPGIRVTYVSETLSLALLEVLVHLKDISPIRNYLVYSVEIADSLVEELPLDSLPDIWRSNPAPAEVRLLGDTWVQGGSSVVLRVPSVIIPHEYNYLINPNHEDFPKVKISEPEPAEFDPRLSNE